MTHGLMELTSITNHSKIPGDTKGGVYDLQVEVYNEDTRVSKKSLISIGDSMSLRVIATTNNREISSGENNGFFGQKHSEETKAKMRGRKVSDEGRARMRAAHAARKASKIK